MWMREVTHLRAARCPLVATQAMERSVTACAQCCFGVCVVFLCVCLCLTTTSSTSSLVTADLRPLTRPREAWRPLIPLQPPDPKIRANSKNQPCQASSETGAKTFRLVLCCAVLCCAVLCCAVLCCAVLCCAVLCCAVLRCAVLCCAVLCCAVLCGAVY
jgi:hypothetical protein